MVIRRNQIWPNFARLSNVSRPIRKEKKRKKIGEIGKDVFLMKLFLSSTIPHNSNSSICCSGEAIRSNSSSEVFLW